jgi:NADH-quinone oxidoreductase subunit A
VVPTFMVAGGPLETAASPTVYWPFVVYFFTIIGLVAAIVGLSSVLGERHSDKEKGTPYESGIEVTGSARLRLSAHFYLIAMLFVIFDLETVFIVAWALGVVELGWSGFIGAMVFIFILIVALIYEWRMGALDWAPTSIVKRS